MIITVQIVPPAFQSPTFYTQVFINIISFIPLISHLASLQKILFFPCRLLETEEQRYSTDTAFNKPRTLILGTYFTLNLIFWAPEPLPLKNLVPEEHEAWTQAHAKSSSCGCRRIRNGCQVIGLHKLLWIFSHPHSRQVTLQRASNPPDSLFQNYTSLCPGRIQATVCWGSVRCLVLYRPYLQNLGRGVFDQSPSSFCHSTSQTDLLQNVGQ